MKLRNIINSKKSVLATALFAVGLLITSPEPAVGQSSTRIIPKGLAISIPVGDSLTHGVVTFVTEDTKHFAAFGHGTGEFASLVNDPSINTPVRQSSVDGIVIESSIIDGQEVFGPALNTNPMGTHMGQATADTGNAVYGTWSGGSHFAPMPYGPAQVGPAKIVTTISGSQPNYLNIEIIYAPKNQDCHDQRILFRITDQFWPAELRQVAASGMSGSPLIQNGMVIGAFNDVNFGLEMNSAQPIAPIKRELVRVIENQAARSQ